jgi:hypothetical protein
VVIGIDDTLERRWGPHIPRLGMYRDAVRSSHKQTIHCSGLHWQVMQVLLPVPWSARVWALPFFSVLVPPLGFVSPMAALAMPNLAGLVGAAGRP